MKILIKLKECIPNFTYDPFFIETPTIIFNALAEYINEKLNKNDSNEIDRIVKFIDILLQEKDESLDALVDELVIGFYSIGGRRNFLKLTEKLAKNSQLIFFKTVFFWIEGNFVHLQDQTKVL